VHRRRRDFRRKLTGLGFFFTIVALAALVASATSDTPRSGKTTADLGSTIYSGPGITGQDDRTTLAEKLKAGAQPEAEQKAEAEEQRKAKAEQKAKAEEQRKAKAERKAKAKAEQKAKADAQARAEAEREAAARSAARSVERAVSDPQAVAHELMGDYGWGEEQFSCLQDLWTNESNWDYTAENPSSGAYGIPQSLPPEKMAEFGDDYRTNPITQIEWGLAYIDERYGTPCSAWSFWQSQSPHWY